MKAVILAGGFGTRMRPLTYLVPKCMLPIGGKPLLERTIDSLKEHGFNEFVICVAYLKKQVIDYFGDGSSLGVDISYAKSELPLGTGGQLKTSEPFIGDAFLAMNGDIVTSLNFANLIKSHARSGGFGTLALKKFEVKIPYGYVNVTSDSQITKFEEKPTLDFLANAGVYVFEPQIFDYIPSDQPSSLETQVFPILIEQGRRINGYFEDAFWADVGSMVDFERIDSELRAEQSSKLASHNNGDIERRSENQPS
jgi:NDP-sugar pyrophosphorylase family protein